MTSAVFSSVQKKGGLNGLKIPLLSAGVFLTLSATSQAGPHGGEFGGGGFHGGFSGGGFHGRFMARGASRDPGWDMDFIVTSPTAVSFVTISRSFFNSLRGLFTGIPTTIRWPILI